MKKDEHRDWYEYLTLEDFHTPAGHRTKAIVDTWRKAKPSAVFVHQLRNLPKTDAGK